MSIHSRLICLLSGVFISCAAIADDSPTVKLDSLPAAAQRTIQSEIQGKGKLGDIEKTVDDGEISYDVELIQGRRERSFGVSPEGKLLYWQVFMNEAPPVVRNAINTQIAAAGGKLEEIDRVVEDGKTSFEVTMTRGDREINFTVSAAGKLLTIEVALEETPAATQKTIRAQTLNATITSLEKNFEDEEVSYDVEATRSGKKISISVDAEGKLIPD
jgi:uncharacterized membrane protein YkoI